MEHFNIHPFGVTAQGEAVERICLDNGLIRCEILTLGATIRTLEVPDRQGQPVDVVLGYDDLESYFRYGGYFGATVGRYANRIAGGRFSLNGEVHTLNTNAGKHHLHGGHRGFSHRVWQVEALSREAVTLSLLSPHAEEGYPGTLKCTAQFRLEGQSLILNHHAVSDRDTLCNLTNHSYFNLSGHDSGSALDQQLQIFASFYTPVDEETIPLGTLEPVAGTVMDLRSPGPIDTPERRACPTLQHFGGFDHNYAIDGPMGSLRPAAAAFSETTGIRMEVETTLPGIQFYTGNFIYPKTTGKGGTLYTPWQGYCLETQFYPDSPNQPSFPSPILRAGEAYTHSTVFRFHNP